MSTKPNPDNRVSTLARLDAIEATTWPNRIATALATMRDHEPVPIHAARTDGTPPTSGDRPIPTIPTDANATTDRKLLIDLVLQREKLGRTISRLLNTWAPTPASDESAWCTHHLLHDRYVPRSRDGSRTCDWCATTNRTWGQYPTKPLIDLHAQGRRLSEADYRRHLTSTDDTEPDHTPRDRPA